ncbi:MAG TPA: hypothetical protein PK542_05460 [Treponemataceae bacterium]|nr:hypothetical protein [Treponemataceae bacterium]HPS43913.1 hypothetical protein [Treponemataceae bacterium]
MNTSALISDKSVPFASSLARSLESRGWAVTLLAEAEALPREGSVAPAKARAARGKAAPQAETQDAKAPESDAIEASATGGADAPSGSGTPAETGALFELSWNRPSVLSAKTVAIALRNRYRALDHAVIVFDSRVVSQASAAEDGTALAQAADRYVRGLALLTYEIASLFSAQGRGRLTFAVREALPAQGAQAAESGGTRPGAEASGTNAAFALSGASVASVARGAFMALAEETAAAFAGTGNAALQTFLVKLDPTDDALNLDWLVARLQAENPQRALGSWVKAGSRGLFGII